MQKRTMEKSNGGINKQEFTPVSEMQYFRDAQLDMSRAYLHGYPGVVVSGIIWFISGLTAIFYSPERAVWTLLIGGVFIFPVSVILNRVLGTSGTHASNNPLGRLAMEGTVFMLICMPLAYMLSFQQVEWFFQGMLVIIGGRYLTFSTLYGTRFYWVLGIGLIAAAFLLFAFNAPSNISAIAGAAIEITFGVFMLISARRKIE
jgi:hypothetical protein